VAVKYLLIPLFIVALVAGFYLQSGRLSDKVERRRQDRGE
jgi:hypothetical protein